MDDILKEIEKAARNQNTKKWMKKSIRTKNSM